MYTQKIDFSGFFRKKAKSDAVKWFYDTIERKINKKMPIFLKLAHIL